jgi:NNP family nitrate/nitrite transporter-like MFS transporter
MKFAEFKKAGHWPTLLAAFLYFDISFMAWVALGPLIVYIVRDMNLAVDEKFTLVAIPVLAGALLRVPMGLLADLFGAKRTGIIAQIVVIAATAWVCYFGLPSKLSVEIFGLALGIGGASFAVALPQASRWYPPQYQGVVMGIAGAGNMGVVLDRRTLGMAGRLRRAAGSDVADPRLLRLRRQGCARRTETDFAEGLWHPAA